MYDMCETCLLHVFYTCITGYNTPKYHTSTTHVSHMLDTSGTFPCVISNHHL